ncbi:hypothetical protein OEZ86_003122 [Tetradesmus obliquus]|nr:hypothetical protein OEZ86_003122 [Tetradesmus obliquus]
MKAPLISKTNVMHRLVATVLAVLCLLATVSGQTSDDPGFQRVTVTHGNASIIQAALDAAAPGTTVTIPAGRYIVREPLIVRKNNITIFARRGAVLDCLNASKPLNSTKPALIVRADSFKRPTMCPEGPKQQFPLKNFTLRGTLQVRNASETAIYIFGVDGFRVSGTSVIDAGKHALASECSKNGAFRNNYARGCKDAAFHAGNSYACTFANNRAEH